MADFLGFQNMMEVYKHSYPLAYNPYAYYNNLDFNYLNSLQTLQARQIGMDTLQVKLDHTKEGMAVVDQENTNFNSDSEGSLSPSKSHIDHVGQLTKTTYSLDLSSAQEEMMNPPPTETPKAVAGIFQNSDSANILESIHLNRSCSKCPSRVLDDSPTSEWAQCSQCFQLVHRECEIKVEGQQENGTVCRSCVDNSETPKLHTRARRAKKIEKPRGPKPKAFRQKSQHFVYLDSFLNGFGYRLYLSEQQIKKEVKSLGKSR